jgi:hypothetical protein
MRHMGKNLWIWKTKGNVEIVFSECQEKRAALFQAAL